MFVVEEFDCFNHDYIKRSDTRDAGEKDVETVDRDICHHGRH
jgi:hypothetical protein